MKTSSYRTSIKLRRLSFLVLTYTLRQDGTRPPSSGEKQPCPRHTAWNVGRREGVVGPTLTSGQGHHSRDNPISCAYPRPTIPPAVSGTIHRDRRSPGDSLFPGDIVSLYHKVDWDLRTTDPSPVRVSLTRGSTSRVTKETPGSPSSRDKSGGCSGISGLGPVLVSGTTVRRPHTRNPVEVLGVQETSMSTITVYYCLVSDLHPGCRRLTVVDFS